MPDKKQQKGYEQDQTGRSSFRLKKIWILLVGWYFYGTRSKKGHPVPDTRVKVFSAKEKIKKED